MKTKLCLPVMFAVLALPTCATAQQGGSVYMEDRINQLQQSITLLTGQIEQLQYQNQQLQQQMEKMQSDYEFRLDQIEKGRGGTAPPRPGPGPSVPPAPSNSGAPPASTAGADQLYKDAFNLLQEGDYAGAEKGFRTFVQKYPQHVLAGNAQYWLGETYYVRKDYDNAATAFALGYQKYPKSGKAADNLLKLGMALGNLGKKSEACAAFTRLDRDFPTATGNVKEREAGERQQVGCP